MIYKRFHLGWFFTWTDKCLSIWKELAFSFVIFEWQDTSDPRTLSLGGEVRAQVVELFGYLGLSSVIILKCVCARPTNERSCYIGYFTARSYGLRRCLHANFLVAFRLGLLLHINRRGFGSLRHGLNRCLVEQTLILNRLQGQLRLAHLGLLASLPELKAKLLRDHTLDLIYFFLKFPLLHSCTILLLRDWLYWRIR
jgi:hypothetical protein